MLKILIAEDDQELRQLFSHVLTKTATKSAVSATARRHLRNWNTIIST